ncbi:uncharacterized protein LOC118349275 [Juglans regia]|uniref:Uncharacterized protein LOC118349275 n=1 Tax=Juglans regia TaxID=51240 RepID=A0A6P9EL35_JUGRE|nr:uncharacterized protein LOC118349275 [Juglans regia]
MAPITTRGRGGQSSRLTSRGAPTNQLRSFHEGSSSMGGSLPIDSTTIESQVHETQSSGEGASTSKVKRGRGKAQCVSFEKLRKTGLIPVKIESGNKGATGTNSTTFISRVGYIARHFAPITCKSWKHIPEVDKEELYARVRGEFLLDWNEDEVKESVKAKLQRSYNDYHHTLHKIFKKYSTKEEAIAHVPDDLNQADWEILCDRWADPKYKKLCDQNALNRSNLKVNHVAGSKSFARLLEEKRGEDTTLIDFYKLTHSKDGSFTTPTAEENYHRMKDLWNERNTAGSSRTAEDIFNEVLGHKSGYAKGLGNYVIPIPSSSRSSKVIQLTQQVEKYKNEMEVYKEKWEESVQRAESMQSNINNMVEKQSEYDRRLSEIMAQLETHRES